MKSIIIYDNESSLRSFEKYNLLKCNQKVYMVYDGKVYNPPIFECVIVTNNSLSDNDLKMIWNMAHSFIIILKKYKTFFDKFSTNIKNLNNFIKITKINKLAQITDHKYRIVDFIIMGTQKGGTTSAQINLAKHPDIYLHNDEIHYFDLHLKKGLKWYTDHFNYNKKMVGEKTPELMYLDSTFPYIQSLNPSLKIILFLRNPVLRAFSAWKMAKNTYNISESFEEAINNELTFRLNENKNFYTASYHYMQRGLYYSQIKKLLTWFPKENILILISEHVNENMTDEYNKIYNFLGLKNFSYDYTKERVANSNEIIDDDLYNKLIKFFIKDIKKLERFLGYSTNWL